MAESSKKDHWSSEAYSTSASFVPQLAHKILNWLDPQSADRVLDVGCGDGKFTAHFASRVSHVLGIDASPAMIEYASKTSSADPSSTTQFRVVDCRHLETEEDIVNGTYDKVISNAALHWILRDDDTRLSTLRAIHASLKPGGLFVFEQGGHGNVAEVVSVFLTAMVHHGFTVEQARATSPWFFPSDVWMRQILEGLGFQVEKCELEYRPTRLTTDASGGLAGWVRLMGAQFLDVFPEGKREDVVKEVCDVLQTVVTRPEDGSQWLGYVRLRGVARKV